MSLDPEISSAQPARRSSLRADNSSHSRRANKKSRALPDRRKRSFRAARRSAAAPAKKPSRASNARAVHLRRRSRAAPARRNQLASDPPARGLRAKDANGVAGSQSRRLERLRHMAEFENKEFAKASPEAEAATDSPDATAVRSASQLLRVHGERQLRGSAAARRRVRDGDLGGGRRSGIRRGNQDTSCALVSSAVASGMPFHSATELALKPEPLSTASKSGPPGRHRRRRDRPGRRRRIVRSSNGKSDRRRRNHQPGRAHGHAGRADRGDVTRRNRRGGHISADGCRLRDCRST